MILAPFPEVASIVTRGVTGQDSDGNDVYGETTTATWGVFAPEGSAESVQARDAVTTTPRFFLAPDAPVPSATDRLTVRGVTYDIDGEPQVFHNPFTGDNPGPVLRLKRVTG